MGVWVIVTVSTKAAVILNEFLSLCIIRVGPFHFGDYDYYFCTRTTNPW